MAENTKIEWAHHTANLWWGCTRVHEGCDNCYAAKVAHHWGFDIWDNERRRMIKGVWKDLARYQKLAAAAGEIHRVFVGSMMDIFEKQMILIDEKGEWVTDGVHDYPTFTTALRDQLFEEIDAGKYPNLLFLFLTKRPSLIPRLIPQAWLQKVPDNVMFGTSPVNQKTATTLIRQLMQVPGRKFLSIEPLLGPVDITNAGIRDGYSVPTRTTEAGVPIEWTDPGPKFIGVDWVIVGGESGHNARPMHPDWVRSIREQCNEAGVPFLFKQWGEWAPPNEDDEYDTSKGRAGGAIIVAQDGTVHCFKDTAGDNSHVMIWKGKKEAGRQLDGEVYDGFPEMRTVKK